MRELIFLLRVRLIQLSTRFPLASIVVSIAISNAFYKHSNFVLIIGFISMVFDVYTFILRLHALLIVLKCAFTLVHTCFLYCSYFLRVLCNFFFPCALQGLLNQGNIKLPLSRYYAVYRYGTSRVGALCLATHRMNFIRPCHNARTEASGPPCTPRWHFVTRVPRNYGNGGRHNGVAFFDGKILFRGERWISDMGIRVVWMRTLRASDTQDVVRSRNSGEHCRLTTKTTTNDERRRRRRRRRQRDREKLQTARRDSSFPGRTGKSSFSFSSKTSAVFRRWAR